MVVKLDSQGNIDLEATGRAVEGLRLHLATEAMRSIQALAAYARQHQWLHRETAEALEKIAEFARIGASALGDEEDEEGKDFPP